MHARHPRNRSTHAITFPPTRPQAVANIAWVPGGAADGDGPEELLVFSVGEAEARPEARPEAWPEAGPEAGPEERPGGLLGGDRGAPPGGAGQEGAAAAGLQQGLPVPWPSGGGMVELEGVVAQKRRCVVPAPCSLLPLMLLP
jgi:hypothetical protein